MACHEELADLWLRDSLPIWRVREAVVPTLPVGMSLHRLDDVWVGAPALAAAIRAADYVVAVPPDAPYEALEDAARRFERATSISWERARGGTNVDVDIRPLIDHVAVQRDARSLLIRARFLPDRGAGRPEDVLGTLESWIGSPIDWGAIVRERLILTD
jgi:hypothetical protein